MARRPRYPDPLADAPSGAASSADVAARADPVCPLCRRPIPPHARQSVHHLVPKLKGGAHGPRARLHQICHDEIHATLTEAELARAYSDPDALRAHPRLARFVAWVARKDPAFHARTQRSLRRRARQTRGRRP